MGRFTHDGTHRLGDKFQWRCHYCGVKLYCAFCYPDQVFSAAKPISRDHVVPKSKGGTNALHNIVAACLPCNHDKADRLLGERKPPRRNQPGCFLGRPGPSRNKRSPQKAFPTFELATAMCDVVNYRTGKDLVPWRCGHCGQWHVALEKDVRWT